MILDKSIDVGFSILDLSKFLMYFTTGIFSAKLLFTDTDSLVYEIEAEDVYEDFYNIGICLIIAVIQKIQFFFLFC